MKTSWGVALFLCHCVLAIPPPENIKDSGKPGRSGGLSNVSSMQQKSAAFPGPVHTITASSSQRPQSGDTTKLRNGKGDTKANFRSYMPSKHQSRVAMKDEDNKDDVSVKSDVSGSERAGPAAAVLANPKVQEAVVDKGIEVAGKLVDKQLQNIDDAQQKASDFLKKEIKLDITPDKGWQNEDMFLPSGYHIDATVSGEKDAPSAVGTVPYLFPAGIGSALMNGCWGTGYKPGDPCYAAKWTSDVCQNMIDGADFIGVGFDGQGKYSQNSRKMTIVQRNCAGKGTYDSLDVPDTMNVHGVYDTSAALMTYESREEYRKHLQEEAGVSGSFLGFSAGVKEAWGESTASASQKYLAVLKVDIERYEIFMDEVKPEHLSMSFLREYMNLPTSYFSAGTPLKYQNFIQRWGTHFVKSAKFGGRLEIRKTMDASDVQSKKEFEKQMEMEYKSLFSSVSAKSSYEQKESSRQQTKTTSTSVFAQGGSQDIASILSDVYSPAFKTQFKEWLETVPRYAKAFRFQMGSITDLLNFKANDLFKDDTVNWGCEGNAASVQTEEKEGKTVKYYEVTTSDGNKTKYYCEYDSRQAVEDALQRRRTCLKRAMEIYLEEGAISLSDMKLDKCKRQKDQPFDSQSQDPFMNTKDKPSWKAIIKENKVWKVSFDMLNDLPNAFRKPFNIERNRSRLVRFYKNMWYTSDPDGSFHLYDGFNNGNNDKTDRKKVSIFGLVLTFNEDDGTLVLSKSDFDESKKFYPTLSEEMKGAKLARMEFPTEKAVKRSSNTAEPCQVKWSNARRFDPTDSKGKCLHFTASTGGTLFVVFAVLPKDPKSRYYVEISTWKVAIYKGTTLKTSTTNINARALGDASLYQSYFVCITESEQSTLVEFGKSLGTSDSGDIYLNMIDNDDHLNVRFYAFGNDENPAMVMDAHIVSRRLTKAECKGDTVKDLETNLCIQKCHKDCDPLAGCKSQYSAKLGEGCNACRVAYDLHNKLCVPDCPGNKTLTPDKKCVPTYDAQYSVGIGHRTPVLPAFTICHWLKLDSVPDLQGYSGKTFFQVYMAGVVSQVWSDLRFGNDNQFVLLMYIRPLVNEKPEIQRVTLNQVRDLKWHQLCVTWSSFSGVVHIYLDGKNILSAVNKQRGEIPGGQYVVVGNKHHLVSEFNLWDRVLTAQEIERNAKTCDGEKGNVMQWHQGFEELQRSLGKYFTPSSCEAPSPSDDEQT